MYFIDLIRLSISVCHLLSNGLRLPPTFILFITKYLCLKQPPLPFEIFTYPHTKMS